MRLYEYEAKSLLAAAGISIPSGGRWPLENSELHFPVVVKAQLLEGGRGKRGGVHFVSSLDEVPSSVLALSRGSAELRAADTILVEEKVQVQRELYLAFSVDRGVVGGVSLLAAREGGVDVEEHARHDGLRVPVALWNRRLPQFVVREVARYWDLPADDPLGDLLNNLWHVFQVHDCLLLEINPLGRDSQGNLVALDARVEVDDAARYRHPEWPSRPEGTRFEVACRELGAVAVEMSGDVAIITSGAGLGMATLDLITALGCTTSCLVDLGGAVFAPDAIVRRIVDRVCDLQPSVILINCFLQLASWQALATEIAEGLKGRLPGTRVIARCSGHEQDVARNILESLGVVVTTSLLDACRETMGLSAGKAAFGVGG